MSCEESGAARYVEDVGGGLGFEDAAESVEFEMSTGTEAVGEGAGAGIPIVVLGARPS